MDATMTRRLEAFFGPALTLHWRGHFGTKSDHYHPDTPEDRKLLFACLADAGLDRGHARLALADVDAVMAQLPKFGYSINLIGGPEL